MPRFRKKPVVIEAEQFNGSAHEAGRIAAWCSGATAYIGGHGSQRPARYVIRIQTLEGLMQAEPGDWIIRGVQGEFYPCKPDIFAATYETGEDPHVE
jgi:hypothetical protein